MQRDTRLILALDVRDGDGAGSLARSCRDAVDAVKVGWPLTLAAGLSIVTRLASDVDVICDFKIADIPPVAAAIAQAAFEAGARGVICHGFAGEDSVRACVEAARGDVFVVTEMSHPGGQQFTAPIAEELARHAVRAGATGIIAPATRPERVRRLREIVGNRLILAPGAGAQGGTPADAILAGADYVIVGRSIAEAKDPAVAARSIVAEFRTAAGKS